MEDLKQFSERDLIDMHHELSEDISRIRCQLEEYKIDRSKGKVWQVSATIAMTRKGQQHQAIQRELGFKKREAKSIRNNSRDRAFINVVTRSIDPDLVKAFWIEAIEAAENNSND